MNEPRKELLIRNSNYSSIADTFDKCVNMGTHALLWCNEVANDENDSVAILFYRRFLEIFDGYSVLLRNGCFMAAKPNLRSIFEVFLQIEYLMQKDSKKRALAYRFVHAKKRISLYECFNSDSNQGKRFMKAKENDLIGQEVSLPDFNYKAPIDNLNRYLQNDEFNSVRGEWKRVRKKFKKNPNWYTLYSECKTIEMLSQYLKRDFMYEILYRSWSNVVHGSDILRDIQRVETGLASIKRIRDTEEFSNDISISLNIFLAVTRILVTHFVPEKMNYLSRWYLENLYNTQRLINPDLLRNKPTST